MDIRPEQDNQIETFLKRLGWPVNSATDEARAKWKIAMKFLIPVKFDVNRAITLYRTHENIRKNENLDRIWISNPQLVREIQSNKFFSLPPVSNQPLTVCFTAANSLHSASPHPQDRELFALQALICQLDVDTESLEVQQNGLNFIYDMQNCSASQFDMNLSKKVLKLLQGGYPAMVKNIFIISAPKWFKIAYKVLAIFLSRKLRERVLMYTPEQMRETLLSQYNYPLEHIPVAFGGLFDPTSGSDTRYQRCFSTVTNPHSICSTFYSQEYQPITTKSSSNILFFNTDHHHPHQQQNSDGNAKRTSSPTSLVAIVALRRNHESVPSQSAAVRKRQSSSSSDSEKRRRSNESLIEEEEPPPRKLSSYIPQDISLNQSQSKASPSSNESSSRYLPTQPDSRASMSENEHREGKRTTNGSSKQSSAKELLTKTQSEIRQEYRKLPNPPAKDTHAARDERNVSKSRYRDVIPGEATRVRLQPDGDEKGDFINANYVSGYDNQEKAYIFTQGPLESTVKDFWRMVWQENISIIVMTTNVRESNTMKCFQYWPADTHELLSTGLYQIQNDESERFHSFVVTKLTLRKKNSAETRTIYHAHYIKWPDHGIPANTKDALEFLERVNYYKQLTKTDAPILLHCSAGIGRTGTFCAIDIGIKRYLERKNLDIPATVAKMRTERAGSVQTEDQYVFAHLALMDYIRQHEILQEKHEPAGKSAERDVHESSEKTSLAEIDDNVRKGTRTKKHGKKVGSDLGAANTLPAVLSADNTNLLEPTSQRGKTLSDSHVSSIQHVTTTTEYNSSIPPSTGNVHPKKARK